MQKHASRYLTENRRPPSANFAGVSKSHAARPPTRPFSPSRPPLTSYGRLSPLSAAHQLRSIPAAICVPLGPTTASRTDQRLPPGACLARTGHERCASPWLSLGHRTALLPTKRPDHFSVMPDVFELWRRPWVAGTPSRRKSTAARPTPRRSRVFCIRGR